MSDTTAAQGATPDSLDALITQYLSPSMIATHGRDGAVKALVKAAIAAENQSLRDELEWLKRDFKAQQPSVFIQSVSMFGWRQRAFKAEKENQSLREALREAELTSTKLWWAASRKRITELESQLADRDRETAEFKKR